MSEFPAFPPSIVNNSEKALTGAAGPAIIASAREDGIRPEPEKEENRMSLEQIWKKLELDEPLTTREDKTFTDELVQKTDALVDALEKDEQ